MLYDPTINRLCAAFPACFSRLDPKPLKIGLDEELLALAGVHPALTDLTPPQLRQALQFYAQRPAYRRSLAKGGPRYGLDGQPAGEVTPEQQRDAAPRPKKSTAPEPPATAGPPAAPAVDPKALLQEGIAPAIAGTPDAAIDGGFRPEKPAVPTFEPKAEPEAATPPAPAPKAPTPKAPAPAPKAPTPKAPTPKAPAPTPKAPAPKAPAPTPKTPAPKAPAPTPKAPTPPGAPAMGYAKLSLKRRT
jgi:hypothetical protein